MDALVLARWQFAITTVYHFFFVPLSIGLSLIVAIMETIYVRTGNPVYKHMTKFWGKLLLINFAIGVATGIVQEFQFGMNWSEYSRFVGDIFGAPLAIEALMAFFLESTFLGIWIFGWEKLSKGLHLTSIWLMAIGTTISSFWILVANSFMHQPVGYVMRNGRAEMDNFAALLTNGHVWVQWPHTMMAAITTAAFFILGISAYHLRRQISSGQLDLFRRSFQIGAIAALIGTLGVIMAGHAQSQYMIKVQPMKMAAAEALWESANPAPMSLFTVAHEAQQRDLFVIKVPGLLSFLSYNRFDGEVKGIKDLQAESEAKYGPGNYIPSVFLNYWTFRAMVGAGMLMLLLAIIALIQFSRDQLTRSPRLLWLLIPGIALPYLANATGWIFTEIGRQPWIVFGLLRTDQAVSNTVGAGMVLTSLIGFSLVYLVLIVATVYLMLKYATNVPNFGTASKPTRGMRAASMGD
ncbi:MAG: cytochrome ubiquinol oxidase subunit I [Oscillochloris sp.]|nr:cytochrome ubiquinol oxidase subunit I [Oscillochloris sp.]